MIVEQEESGNMFSEIVVDHATNPRNAGSIPDADAYALVLGPCGDNRKYGSKSGMTILSK
jgi:NifU-like protein involved in Fe-S cluster formation